MGVGLLLALTASLTLSGPAEADNIGSMNTTDTGCVAVNINHYDLKTDVWLAGKNFQPGLPLYFKVTSPSGTPLGDDNGVPKAVEPDGSFCLQLWAQVVMSNDGVTQGYLDTDNDGNEYKVTVSTTPDFDPTKSDNFKVEACEGDCGEQPTPADDPTASKDATPSFDRTYSWSVAKTADKTVVKQAGGTVTVNYTVTATMTGYTDSNYAVSGTVTVTNPNAADITGASVADDVTGCSITDPATNVTLAPGPNAFAYSCVFTDTSKEANTATVTWPTQDVDGHELVGGSTTTDPATWDWDTVVPDEVDECVTVTDAFDGGAAVSLGSACRAESPQAFTYSRTIPVPASGCRDYANTATSTTGDLGVTATSGWSVRICGPYASGAHTIGFWKNTNGQGLIGTYCAPSGKTGLATYLSTLGGASAPFAGAAGKTCAQLKTYVTGILNGANATDMNVMLKAQMLATALDVYFSSPAMGFTSTTLSKVKPPSTFLVSGGLGFSMDTTAVCPMVDNTTTGTALCSGGKPSTNAVASGALPSASMTPQAILTYAATTPSPFNAGVWYAGNRTKQTILKNVFDQINNRLAFQA